MIVFWTIIAWIGRVNHHILRWCPPPVLYVLDRCLAWIHLGLDRVGIGEPWFWLEYRLWQSGGARCSVCGGYPWFNVEYRDVKEWAALCRSCFSNAGDKEEWSDYVALGTPIMLRYGPGGIHNRHTKLPLQPVNARREYRRSKA